MTAPVSLFAGLAQPAARAAMGDAVGAGLTGFDALLAMLTQALDGTGDKAAGEPSTEDAETSDAAADPSLAAWLARGGDSALMAQTLGGAGGEGGESPETCAVSVKSIVGDLLGEEATTETPGATDSANDAAPETPWHRPTPGPIGTRTEADAAAALARLRETVPAEALPAALADQAETALATAQTATSETATLDAGRQAAAAAAVPTDPRPSASRKPGAAASAAAELKSERQDATAEAAKTAETPTAVEAADATADALSSEPPPAELEVAPPPARNAERPETITQALIGRLDALSATAANMAAQVRGAPETVAKLAAGILDKLEGQSTRFDLQLDPLGLGKVDVSVEIAADGRLTAQLGFDSAQGLAELRGRAQELRQALEQAGFSLGDNGLSFDFSGQQRRQDAETDTPASTSRAFAQALGLEAEADAAPIRYQARRGLDLLV
jgi:flagellar hook-length control protein FliK